MVVFVWTGGRRDPVEADKWICQWSYWGFLKEEHGMQAQPVILTQP
jgi:hypothetical protein